MKREQFLTDYLCAYGAERVVFTQVNAHSISGTAIYVEDDPEERQDFRWDGSEENAPPEAVCRLANLLNTDKLLDSDKITLTRQQLRELYNKQWQVDISVDDFNKALDTLELIEIRIFDEDGTEANPYFIHE